MNRLSNETSPYLLQHAGNPVDWYPWGQEALERARNEDRPILLSIGYAACHWCHVMEHESFENEATAALMNELFVSIKVDREERPDLDGIYMQAVQAMTGQGGWPMTVFLTPSCEPFYGGTYYPPVDRQGMPAFSRILRAVADAYRNKRDAVDGTAERLREIYDAASRPMGPAGELTSRSLENAYRSLGQSYDATHGGFGGAPKFPPSMTLDFLLQYWTRTGTEFARDMAIGTFRAMARGGIYDQVGGGLHRYSVDDRWLVPHFEKMLYDNALFTRLGVHLWQATKDAEIKSVTEETIGWVAREMTSAEGGFYSSLDADSEGHEGKFYVWDELAIDALLGDADVMKSYWGVSEAGNFEGRNILHVAAEPSIAARRAGIGEAALAQRIAKAKCTLYGERARRVWPGRDEKILASWNGLMLRAVAEAARAFSSLPARAMALRNGEFLRDRMVHDGRVVRSYKDGVSKEFGFLEDHAAVALGFLELYALTFERSWLDSAIVIADSVIARFRDDRSGLFFDTPSDHEALITRPRDITDNAIPSGTSLVADLLLRLAVITGRTAGRADGQTGAQADGRARGEEDGLTGELAEARTDGQAGGGDYGRMANEIVRGVAEPLGRYPSAFGHLLGVADMAVFGAIEVSLVGDVDAPDFAALRDALGTTYVPSLVLAGGIPAPESEFPLLHGRVAREGRATAYVCRDYACDSPTTSPEELVEQLLRAAGASSTLSSG